MSGTRRTVEQLLARLESADAEHIAAGVVPEAALFLASDASSSVNGVELFADGGSAQIRPFRSQHVSVAILV